MATVKVTALAETTSPQAADVLLISQSGVSKKVQITNLPASTPGTGSISTAMLADDAVTTDKLANSINSAITANTAKTSNVTHTGDVTGATALTIASGAVETGMIADDAVTAAKLANSINAEITANTAKTTNATHTGDVTGATTLTIGNDKVITAKILDDNVTAAKLANSINTDIATGVTANTTANAALPKAGGTMTGNIAHAGDFTLDMGGNIILDANGGGIYFKDDGTTIGFLQNSGASDFRLVASQSDKDMVFMGNDGGSSITALTLDMSEAGKATFNSSVVVGTNAVGTMTTDNDGSFAMSASNNFKCTPAGNFALTFTAIVAQSGNILFINSGGHTISAHANTKVDATLLATISTAGTYLLSYFSDGTNVYMTNSAAYA